MYTHILSKKHPYTNEKPQKRLAPCFKSVYIAFAFAKSEAEPRNSQYISVANNSTPLNYRAFFVCCTRTPKKRYNIAVFSMVACNGKGFALCCIPLIAVFEPVTRYRPQASKLQAVAPKNSSVELSAMQNFAYSFLCVNRTAETYQEEVIRVIANSEENARFQLTADYRLLLAHPIAKIRLNSTACTAKGGIYA